MLDTNIQSQLATHFQRLDAPVELVASLDATTTSTDLRTLLGELASLSPRITFRDSGLPAEARRPSFRVGRAGAEGRVRFAGLPMGHEFTSLVLALLQTGGVAPKIDPTVAAAIRRLPPMKVETFVSLSCHNCPEVVQAFNAMAALNPGITHEMVDGGVFQDEVAARKIMGVPAVFIDDKPFGQGRMTLDEIVARLEPTASAAKAEQLSELAPYDVLVVGGGPAGAAAAVYAARKGIRTGLVAERFGGQVGDTLGIENFISVAYTEGPKLVAAMEQQVLSYGVEVTSLQRVQRLIPAREDGGLHTVVLASGARLRARSVILATGAKWREMQVPGESEYRTKGVAFCPHCDGPLFKGKRVAVIGGGNSGVEAAIDLAGIVGHVTLLEFDAKLRADEVLQRKLRSLANVEVRRMAQTTTVRGDGSKVVGLTYRDRESGAEHQLDVAGIFVQIGLLPNTDWLRGTLELSRHGEIVVDARGQTSIPGIFAAGDATTVPFKQIVIAMGDGAKASLAAFDHLVRSAPIAIPVPAAAPALAPFP